MKRFRWPIITGIVGVLLVAVGGGWLVKQVVDVANTASLTQFVTPGEETVNLAPGEYAVYELVGVSSINGTSGFSSGVTSEQVSVTGPSGPVAVRCANCSAGTEELTLNGSVFNAVAHFDATTTGDYTVKVTGDGNQVAVAYSVSGLLAGVVPALFPLVIGGFLIFAAAVSAIIVGVTGKRDKNPTVIPASTSPAAAYNPSPKPDGGAAPHSDAPAANASASGAAAGWYPNPDNPNEKRWWTGSSWSDIVEK